MNTVVDKLPGYEKRFTDPEEVKILLESIAKDASRKLTICEQIRFAYDLVIQLPCSELKQAIIEQLVDIFGSGKRMNARLAHYKRHFLPKDGRGGKSIKSLSDTNNRKKMRRLRI